MWFDELSSHDFFRLKTLLYLKRKMLDQSMLSLACVTLLPTRSQEDPAVWAGIWCVLPSPHSQTGCLQTRLFSTHVAADAFGQAELTGLCAGLCVYASSPLRCTSPPRLLLAGTLQVCLTGRLRVKGANHSQNAFIDPKFPSARHAAFLET